MDDIEDKLQKLHDSKVVWAWQSALFRKTFTKYAHEKYPGRKPNRAYEDWCAEQRTITSKE